MKYSNPLISFILLLSTPIFISAPAIAGDYDLGGSARVRYETTDNSGDFNSATDDKTGFHSLRFRLNFTFNPNDDLKVFMQPQFTKVGGVPSGQLEDRIPTSATGSTTDDAVQGFHQAYLAVKAGESTTVTVGRQELAYGDHLLIGTVGWHNVGRSFDAFRVNHKHNWGWTDFFVADVSDGLTAVTPTNEHYLTGLYNGMSFGNIKHVDLYYFNYLRPLGQVNITTTKDEISYFGLRLKSSMDQFDYRVEATSQSGISGSQADVEVGYMVMPDSKFRVALEYFMASKDYLQLFPTGHKWLGVADYFSRRNMNGIRVGLSGKIGAVMAKLDYHMFSRADTAASAYKFKGAAYGTTGTATAVADEIDVSFKYMLNDATYLTVGGAQVTPGKYLKDNVAGAKDAGSFYFVQTGAKF